MARNTAFVAIAVLCLAGAQARVLLQDAALAPGSITTPPPAPVDPKGKKSLGDLTGLPGLPPIGSFIFPNGTICQNSGIGNIGCSNDGNFNIGSKNTGTFNTGNANNGNFNNANANNGNFNKGDANAGSFNSGSQNNGNYNVGNQNNGNGNSGNQNEGTANSGNQNLGIANSGNANNGNFNGGDTNMGTGNNGSTNAGDGNLGSNNVGDFNGAGVSYQTGSYIGLDGTVNLYPIVPPPSAPQAAVASAPTLSQVLSGVFGGDTQLIPVSSTTSLGDLIGSIAGGGSGR